MTWLRGRIASARRLATSEFSRNVSFLASGTAISMAVTVAASPITTRLYAPQDYGVFALYITLGAVLGVLATGQYTQAIILPRTDADARDVVALCLLVVSGVVGGVLLITLTLNDQIARLARNEHIAGWLYWLPCSIALAAGVQILTAWCVRHRRFREIASSQVAATLSTTATALALGALMKGPFGLIVSTFVGQLLSLGMLLRVVLRQDAGLTRGATLAAVRVQAKAYAKFPRYAVGTEFINSLTNALPVFLLSRFFGPVPLGHYNLTQRVFGIPFALFGSSMGEVFRQRASYDLAHTGTCRPIYVKTAKVLTVAAVGTFSVIIVGGPQLFGFVFGSEWRTAGEYARVLGIMYIFRFVCSPLSAVYSIVGRQKEDMLLHIYMAVSTVASMYLAYRTTGSATVAIAAFALNYAIIYLIYAVRGYSFSKGPPPIPPLSGPGAPVVAGRIL